MYVKTVTEVHLHISDSTLVSDAESQMTNWSLFEFPFLPTHGTKLIHLLRVEPLNNAVNMEAVWTLTPHYNNNYKATLVSLFISRSYTAPVNS